MEGLRKETLQSFCLKNWIVENFWVQQSRPGDFCRNTEWFGVLF